MSNNLYGGILYPNSSFHIDQIYNSFTEANGEAGSDGILVGRYILIAYTKRPFSQKEKTTIHALIGPDNSISESVYNTLNAEEKSYVDNLIKDNILNEEEKSDVDNLIKDIEDYDRILCRKAYNDETTQNENSNFYYEPIANLSTTFDLTDQDNDTFLKAFEEVVNEFNDIDKDLDSDLKKSKYYQDLFTEDWNMDPITVTEIKNENDEIIGYDEQIPVPDEIDNGIIQKAEERAESLKVVINNATTKNDILNTTIQNAITKDDTLNTTIDNADAKNTELTNSISNADAKNVELTITIDNAETAKNNLNDVINQAEGITTAFYWKPFPVKEEA